jgi:phage tail sheath protein FI
MNTAGYDSKFAALYYPWIEVMDPLTNKPMMVPPSGHVAGLWCRTDATRGVHKAPANEIVMGANGLGFQVTHAEQGGLNKVGINCIRAFPGRGIRVWGARTMSSDPEWRYINVRRLFNFVERSIEQGTQWVVFEPNDPQLWARIRRDVGAFLTSLWREGMLFGANPTEAFFVKCDEELNPSVERDNGRLLIDVGLAPVKPAEFVIFRLSQYAGGGA